MFARVSRAQASMWMLLRGGSIVFVALMKQFGLRTPLSKSNWVGVGVIAIAVCLVGCSPMFASVDNDELSEIDYRRRLRDGS